MYKHLLLSLLVGGLFFGNSFGQNVPSLMQYQAVARNSSGVLANQPVPIQVTILKNNVNGTPVYAEVHNTVQTNEFGLFSLSIGGGAVTMGTNLSAIDWGADTYWLRIGFRPPGQSDFLLLNATQLLSVPYALFAGKAANATGGDPDSTNELQMLTQNGLNVTLSHGGGTISVADNDNDPVNEIQVLSKTGNTVTLSKNGGSFIDEVNDADADPTNELQTLSISGSNLSISNGNTLSLAGIGSQWVNNPQGIHYTSGNVGIGTPIPAAGLDVVNGANVPALQVTKTAGAENIAVFRRDPDPAFKPVMVMTRPGNVGVGTDNPEATLQVNGTVKMLGNWELKNPGSTYHAPSDGFVVVRLTVTGNNKIRAEGSTSPDNNFTEDEIRAGATAWSNADVNSFTLPVAKDEYWKVEITAQDPAGTNIWVRWRPVGL